MSNFTDEEEEKIQDAINQYREREEEEQRNRELAEEAARRIEEEDRIKRWSPK